MQAIVFCAPDMPLPHPFYEERPFALFPVMNRPILVHMLEWLADAGVTDLVLVPDHLAFELRSEIGSGERFGLHVQFVSGSSLGDVLLKLAGSLEEQFCVFSHLMIGALPLKELCAEVPEAANIRRFDCDGGPVCLSREAVNRYDFSSVHPEQLVQFVEEQGGTCQSVSLETSPCVFRRLRDVWAANVRALQGEFPDLVVRGTESAEGVRMGLGARVHTAAQLEPPVFVGSHSVLAREVNAGPDAVLGAGCMVEHGAELSSCVILDGSYIGPNVTVRNALVSGNVLVSFPQETVTVVPDLFVLGGTGRVSKKRHIFSSFCALLGILLFSPFFLLMGVLHALGIRRFFVRDLVGEELPPQLDGKRVLRDVRRSFFQSRIPVLRELPGLFDVLRGRLEIVGIEPLEREQAEMLHTQWAKARFTAPAGLLHPWHAFAPRPLEDVEKRVMECHYAATRSVREDLKVVLRSPRHLFI